MTKQKPRWSPEDYVSKPRDYDPRLCEQILDRIANGEMLPDVCASADYPLPGVFLRWCEEYPTLNDQYLAARRIGVDVNLDQAVIESTNADASIARVRSENLRWHVERSRPEKYGPRSTIKTLDPDKEDEGGGIDWGGDVRRKLDEMAARREAAARVDADTGSA